MQFGQKVKITKKGFYEGNEGWLAKTSTDVNGKEKFLVYWKKVRDDLDVELAQWFYKEDLEAIQE